MKIRTDCVIPALGQLRAGDAIVPGPPPMLVREVVPERALVLGPPSGGDVEASWSLNLLPHDPDRTRLVTRVRARWRWTPRMWWLTALIDPGAFVIERKMLLGLKRRAEGRPRRQGCGLRSERTRRLVGDEPIGSLTHAVTIRRPRSAAWPWLAQMGAERAGWYSYDALDNGGAPSNTRILPHLTTIAVADVLPALAGETLASRSCSSSPSGLSSSGGGLRTGAA